MNRSNRDLHTAVRDQSARSTERELEEESEGREETGHEGDESALHGDGGVK